MDLAGSTEISRCTASKTDGTNRLIACPTEAKERVEPRSSSLRRGFLHIGFLANFALGLLASPGIGNAAEHTVVANPDNTFHPADISISPGDVVTWSNAGGLHNVESPGLFRCANGCDGDGEGGDGNPALNAWTFSKTFDDPGTIEYSCSVHQEQGIVRIEAPDCFGCVTTVFELISGSIDDFAGDLEHADPGPAIQTYIAANSTNAPLLFDEIPGEAGALEASWFGYSQHELPGGISGVTLEIGLRASIAGSATPDDDLLVLEVEDGVTPLWSREIHDLTSDGTWGPGQQETIVLDLEALPGESDPIDLLSAVGDGKLNLAIGDSTGVDSIQIGVTVELPYKDVLVRHDSTFDNEQAVNELTALGVEILEAAPYFQRINIRGTPAQIDEVETLGWVVRIQPLPIAPSQPLITHVRHTTGIEAVQDTDPSVGGTISNPYNLSGDGVHVALLDAGPIAHDDLCPPRATVETTVAPYSNHPSLVAGIIAGNGQESLASGASLPFEWRGAAPKARLFSYNFTRAGATTTMLKAVQDNDAKVINVSMTYSHRSVGDYDDSPYAADVDQLVYNSDTTVVWAAGNTKYQSSPDGAMLSDASCKNCISVGATINDLGAPGLHPNSARGLTEAGDDRLKPDIVAPGSNMWNIPIWKTHSTPCTSPSDPYGYVWFGTSFAAPVVSGSASLLVEHHRRRFDGDDPAAALVKNLLLNTADDGVAMTNPGPDPDSGFGFVDVASAVEVLDRGQFLEGQVEDGGVTEHLLEVQGPCELRVMMTYSDPPCFSGACEPALINDLDLELEAPNGAIHYPLVVDPAAPHLPATEQANRRDNVEQVVLQLPSLGVWKIRVRGYDVPVSPQRYALTWYSVGGASCVLEPTEGDCHLPWDTALCIDDSTADVTLTVTNSTGQAADFDYSLSALPAGSVGSGGGCHANGPTGFSPQSGQLNGVSVGASRTSTITVDRPLALDSDNTVACYQATVHNRTTGDLFTCRGSFWYSDPACIRGTGGDVVDIVAVDGFEVIGIDVTNNSTFPEEFGIEVSAMTPGQVSPAVSLNDLPLGSNVLESVFLQPGELARVEVQASFPDLDIGTISDVLFSVDQDGDGQADVVASQGVRPIMDTGAPGLALAGACPGPPGILEVSFVGGTPGGDLGIVTARTLGSDPIPGGPCGGLATDLSNITLVTLVPLDGSGSALLTPNLPIDQCGKFVQAIDMSSCEASNVERVPYGGCGSGDRYEDQMDGTVLDCNTGLFWLKDASCDVFRGHYLNWDRATKRIATLADGDCGLSDGSSPGDWRLPTIDELCGGDIGEVCDPNATCDPHFADFTLINSSVGPPTVVSTRGDTPWTEGDPFVDLRLSYYWSGTEFDANEACTVETLSGTTSKGGKSGFVADVWPVRGANSGVGEQPTGNVR